MNKRLLVLCNLNCVSSHLGCMGSGKLYECNFVLVQHVSNTHQGAPKGIHSQQLLLHHSHASPLVQKPTHKKKRWIARIPRGQKYISFNQQRKTERQRASEQIHIVSSHRELGDRKKVSFHGKFPDYYSSSPISAIPTSTPLVSHGRKMKDKDKDTFAVMFNIRRPQFAAQATLCSC